MTRHPKRETARHSAGELFLAALGLLLLLFVAGMILAPDGCRVTPPAAEATAPPR